MDLSEMGQGTATVLGEDAVGVLCLDADEGAHLAVTARRRAAHGGSVVEDQRAEHRRHFAIVGVLCGGGDDGEHGQEGCQDQVLAHDGIGK